MGVITKRTTHVQCCWAINQSNNLLAKMISPVNSPGSPGIPGGLMLPDIIITRRTRTHSMNGRIEEDVHEGTVRFFCRSKGHGFIDDDTVTAITEAKNITQNGHSTGMNVSIPVFMHISDIDGEYIPRKGDRVRYQTCPMPPRFDKPQAVHIQIIDFTPEVHHRWCDKETPEELEEDKIAIKEEQEMNECLKRTPPHRRVSGTFPTVQESPDEGPPTCNDV